MASETEREFPLWEAWGPPATAATPIRREDALIGEKRRRVTDSPGCRDQDHAVHGVPEPGA
ncbi:hypothetical protein [Streptosporangium sp. NPDC051022]|uniref:hypothetical protein n=1 Tax=Streptosporangium sp. NPDC051022 TaxID=3155752 RepID=UPI00343370B4